MVDVVYSRERVISNQMSENVVTSGGVISDVEKLIRTGPSRGFLTAVDSGSPNDS